MANLKKVAAFLTAAMITASIAGCKNTTYAMKANNEEIKTGVYVSYLYSEINEQSTALAKDGNTASPLTQTVEGKGFAEYVEEAALTKTKEYFAIKEKFNELKLKLDTDELKKINSSIASTWEDSGEFYEKMGISRESYKAVNITSDKRTAVFKAVYGEGGTDAVSNDELVKYVNDNYLRFKILSFAKNASDEDADKESQAQRDKYLKMAKGLSFEEFDTVIDAYTAEQKEKQEHEQQESQQMTIGDTYDLDNDVEVNDTATADVSVADATAQTTTESAVDKTLSSFAAAATTEPVVVATADSTVADNADDTTADDAKVDDAKADDTTAEAAGDAETTGAEDAEAEEDPYKNEQMENYALLSDEDLEGDSGKLLSEIKGMKENKVTSYENDSAYYIIIKGKVSDRSKEYVADKDNNLSVLSSMKKDDFQKKLDGWVKEIKFEINSDAMKEFSTANVYKIMTENSKEQTQE